MLQGLGLAAAGTLILQGCQTQGSTLPNANTNACGPSTCIDLTDPANKDLTTAGGALLFDTSSDTIMVIRTSDTQVVAISAICTHAGCSMNYDGTHHLLDCPCHGSQFAIDGSVLKGPARQAVRVYTATLANNTITITS